MMEFMYSLMLAIQNLKKFKNIALINGVIWLGIWIIIAFLTWHLMISFTSKLLYVLPFSFIRSSGAFIIYTILWFQAILVTIGFIFSLFNEFLKKRYLWNILIGIAVISFWSLVFIFFEKNITEYIKHLLLILPFNTTEELMSAFLAILFYYMLFVSTLSFSFFIFSLKKLAELAKEEYNVEVKNFSFNKLILIIIRDFFKFIILSVIFYPVLLIPFLNFIFVIFIFAYTIRDSLLHIISAFEKNIDKSEVIRVAIISTFLNFLPILNVFAPALGLLHLFYYTMEKNENI